MMSRRTSLAAAALLVALPLAPVAATVHPGYDQLAKSSDLVVIGRITGVENPGAATRTVELTASSLIKGRLPTPTTVLTVRYTRVGKGNIDFKAYQSSGEKVLVFLKQRKGKDDKPIAEFELTDAWFGLARWDTDMMMTMAKSGFALEAFGDWIIAALGGLVVFTMTLLLLWKAPEPEAAAATDSARDDEPAADEADKPAEDSDKPDEPAEREADEPAVREADEPAEREADRPAVREADQPAVREADQPAERAADTPADEADKASEGDRDKPADDAKADKPDEAKADDADKPADGDKPKE